MKKVRLIEEKELSLGDVKISDQLGFVDSHGDKGHFVYVGYSETNCMGELIHCAVSLGEYFNITTGERRPSNMSYGNNEENVYTEVPTRFNGTEISIRELYKFETRKELYKWLSE